MPITERRGTFSDVVYWSGLQRFVAECEWIGSDDHNYHYEMGAYLTAWSGRKQSVEGMFRYQFQSKRPPEQYSSWRVDSDVFVNEVGVRYRRELGAVTTSIHFRHDSKHELDQVSRRMAAHDAVGIEVSVPIAAGRRVNDPNGFVRGMAEAKLPLYVFQELDLEEEAVYRGMLAAEAEIEPFHISGRHPVFVNARLVGLLNERPAEIDGTALEDEGYYADLDYQLRAGVRFRGAQGSVVVYGGFERLSDDWVDQERIRPAFEPVHLLSIGVLLLGGR